MLALHLLHLLCFSAHPPLPCRAPLPRPQASASTPCRATSQRSWAAAALGRARSWTACWEERRWACCAAKSWSTGKFDHGIGMRVARPQSTVNKRVRACACPALPRFAARFPPSHPRPPSLPLCAGTPRCKPPGLACVVTWSSRSAVQREEDELWSAVPAWLHVCHSCPRPCKRARASRRTVYHAPPLAALCPTPPLPSLPPSACSLRRRTSTLGVPPSVSL